MVETLCATWRVPLKFNEVQLFDAAGSALAILSATITGGDAAGCFDGATGAPGCASSGTADGSTAMKVNVACGADGGVASRVARVVVFNSADADRPAGIQVQLLNSSGSVADTVFLSRLDASTQFWTSKEACRPGQGGDPCQACSLGTYSAVAFASTPKPACLACPSGFTTASTGAESAAAFSGPRACACLLASGERQTARAVALSRMHMASCGAACRARADT